MSDKKTAQEVPDHEMDKSLARSTLHMSEEEQEAESMKTVKALLAADRLRDQMIKYEEAASEKMVKKMVEADEFQASTALAKKRAKETPEERTPFHGVAAKPAPDSSSPLHKSRRILNARFASAKTNTATAKRSGIPTQQESEQRLQQRCRAEGLPRWAITNAARLNIEAKVFAYYVEKTQLSPTEVFNAIKSGIHPFVAADPEDDGGGKLSAGKNKDKQGDGVGDA